MREKMVEIIRLSWRKKDVEVVEILPFIKLGFVRLVVVYL